jgi:nicotinamidase-related amidase
LSDIYKTNDMDNSQNVNTALLVMDAHILHRLDDEKVRDAATGHLQKAIATARRAGLPVVYVVVTFRQGWPEVNVANKAFGAWKQSGGAPGMEEPARFPPALAPQAGDLIVTKRRVSAFTGSDLEVILRSGRIEHLVLTGFATSGVVLSTLREAADKDFRVTVLSDGCADRDEEVHTVLLTKVFPRQADVMTVAEWEKTLKR